MKHKIADISLIILTLVILIIPVITMNHLPDQVSVIENRSLAKLPSFSNGPSAFMHDISSYLDDRIGFREEMMHFYNRWNYSILKGNHSKVISGKDGWLFYKDTLDDYIGANIDLSKTATQVRILTAIDEWCKERGIVFVLAIGPNKATIYDNYMPDSIYHAPVSNLDCLLEALAESDIHVYCPKEELIVHRGDTEIYYRQDTHWNSYGSRYLLDEMVAGLDLPVYDIPLTESRSSSGDLLTMLGIGENNYTTLYTHVPLAKDAYVEQLWGMDRFLHSSNTAPFVCYRDSFNQAMIDYYSYYFNGPIYWCYNIDFDYVENSRPKYLILSCAERYLDVAINSNSAILTQYEVTTAACG